MDTTAYQAVVIGVSAGGMNALNIILPELPVDYPLPVIIVQHIREDMLSNLAEFMDNRLSIAVTEVIDKTPIKNSTVYIAPPGYHLLVEDEHIFSLSEDPRVNYSRPSIDVLFESAADVYVDRLVGVILTGANSDGALGLKKIKAKGGLTIVQDPDSAEAPEMPRAAIDLVKVDQILPLQEMGQFLAKLCQSTDCKLLMADPNER